MFNPLWHCTCSHWGCDSCLQPTWVCSVLPYRWVTHALNLGACLWQPKYSWYGVKNRLCGIAATNCGCWDAVRLSGRPCCQQQDVSARERPTSYGHSDSVQVCSEYAAERERSGEAGGQPGWGLGLETGIGHSFRSDLFDTVSIICYIYVHWTICLQRVQLRGDVRPGTSAQRLPYIVNMNVSVRDEKKKWTLNYGLYLIISDFTRFNISWLVMSNGQMLWMEKCSVYLGLCILDVSTLPVWRGRQKHPFRQ